MLKSIPFFQFAQLLFDSKVRARKATVMWYTKTPYAIDLQQIAPLVQSL